jgi:hypothetical protein
LNLKGVCILLLEETLVFPGVYWININCHVENAYFLQSRGLYIVDHLSYANDPKFIVRKGVMLINIKEVYMEISKHTIAVTPKATGESDNSSSVYTNLNVAWLYPPSVLTSCGEACDVVVVCFADVARASACSGGGGEYVGGGYGGG